MKILRFGLFAVLLAAHAHATTTLINFDTAGNWIASLSGSLGTSYQSDHVYAESGWRFRGGPALRQTTTAQDGCAGALGTYAWRLNQSTTVSWTATYTNALAANTFFSGFGFDVRRRRYRPAHGCLRDSIRFHFQDNDTIPFGGEGDRCSMRA